MAIGGKWPHCLSPDGPVAPARFHKWLPCLWINCCWSQQSVQISTYLQLRAAGQRPQREASLQSCFSVTDVNRSCCWLEVISCQSSLQSWPEFGERSELICWPSGWKHNERLTLLKWDLSTPRNSLRPHYDADACIWMLLLHHVILDARVWWVTVFGLTGDLMAPPVR